MKNSSDAIDVIQTWFDRELGGSLMLPDGWFGRSYDNIYHLKYITCDNDVITVALDNDISLNFDRLGSVKDNKNELIFDSFKKCSFLWRKDSGSIKKEFFSGQVKIISSPVQNS